MLLLSNADLITLDWRGCAQSGQLQYLLHTVQHGVSYTHKGAGDECEHSFLQLQRRHFFENAAGYVEPTQ